MCDALGACTELHAVYRRLLRMALEELQLIEQQRDKLEQEMANLLRQHEDAIKPLPKYRVWGWIRRSRSSLK